MGIFSFAKNLKQIFDQRPRVPADFGDHRLVKAILDRRSVRRFLDQDIKDAEMDLILEAGRLAPSTVNMQTWSFGVFSETTWGETFNRSIPFGAKRAVVVLGDITRMKRAADIFPHVPLVEYTVCVINASLAAMNMTVMAQALGLGSVMLSDTGKTGFFSPAYLKDVLKLPRGVFPLMTVVFGYARKKSQPLPPKFDLADISFSGTYRKTETGKIRAWFSLMETGYKASHFFSSFQAKLRYYRNNLERAEGELRGIVFERDR
jgi:nitroreductase